MRGEPKRGKPNSWLPDTATAVRPTRPSGEWRDSATPTQNARIPCVAPVSIHPVSPATSPGTSALPQQMGKFIRRAEIPIFIRPTFSSPKRRSCYNDDVFIETYRHAQLPTDGLQRIGVHEPLGECRTCTEHVKADMRGISPFSASTPRPAGTLRAAVSLARCPWIR